MKVRKEPTQVEHLSVPHFKGRFTILLSNVRLALKSLAKDKHFSLCVSVVCDKVKKGFMTLTPGVTTLVPAAPVLSLLCDQVA